VFKVLNSDIICRSTATATYHQVDNLVRDQNEQHIVKSLQKAEFISKPIPSSCPGTGKWFVNHSTYQSWCNEPPSILWCHGPPGVGKSFLASIAIHDLSAKATFHSPLHCVTYFFCDVAARKQQDTSAILRSLLLQVVERGDRNVVSFLSSSRSAMGTAASAQDLAKSYSTACQHQRTFLVLDAPGELDKPKELLAHLHSFVEAGCWVLVMSRDIPDVRGTLQTARQIEVQATREDLVMYIKARFSESDFPDTISENNGILDGIIEKSSGM
jgi:hypothetical protein